MPNRAYVSAGCNQKPSPQGTPSVKARSARGSAPVLGRSNVKKRKDWGILRLPPLMEIAAPEDGRTPPPSLRHYHASYFGSLSKRNVQQPRSRMLLFSATCFLSLAA